MKKELKFFIPLKKIPSATHQQKQVNFETRSFYEPEKVKEARSLFMSVLFDHVPEVEFKGPIRLMIKWCYKKPGVKSESWKTTKPDLDNLNKLVQDCMTQLGYWNDDAQISSLIIEKMWTPVNGIFVGIEEL